VGIEVMHLVRIDAGVLHGRNHAATRPVGIGAVMWYASPLMPKPESSA
jgi:hypothetical protein